MDETQLLQVKNLRVDLQTEAGVLPAVRKVDFTLHKGKTLAVVGESGSGKTMMGYALMRLVPLKLEKRLDGEILYYGGDSSGKPRDIAAMDPRGQAIRRIRGKEIAMIFQEPMSSLSPIHTVGNQIVEAIRLHRRSSPREAKERAIELLQKVKLPRPDRQFTAYPHELSGGMRQRVMIAMALSCDPKILIADEPTTALDVTIQAQILDLLGELQAETGLAILLVTHDLGVVAQVAHEVAVMYLGSFIEQADVHTLFENPLHPYTRGLLTSLPHGGKGERLQPIRGTVPDPLQAPSGCLFSDRCPEVFSRCREAPPFFQVQSGHTSACWLHDNTSEGATSAARNEMETEN